MLLFPVCVQGEVLTMKVSQKVSQIFRVSHLINILIVNYYYFINSLLSTLLALWLLCCQSVAINRLCYLVKILPTAFTLYEYSPKNPVQPCLRLICRVIDIIVAQKPSTKPFDPPTFLQTYH